MQRELPNGPDSDDCPAHQGTKFCWGGSIQGNDGKIPKVDFQATRASIITSIGNNSCRNQEKISKITEEREALAANLDRRRHRRDFDLSRVGDEQQRTNLARRYVEATDKLHQLHAQFRLLETAKRLGSEWQDNGVGGTLSFWF